MKSKLFLTLAVIFLCGCSSATQEQINTVSAQLVQATLLAREVQPTSTSLASTAESVQSTLTGVYTLTLTPTNTQPPTLEPCTHVNLNGRYVDIRTNPQGTTYGWIMEAEQHGCEFTASEIYFIKKGESVSEDVKRELSGKIEGDKVRVCYTHNDVCVDLVILGGGQTLANNVEDWQFEKTND